MSPDVPRVAAIPRTAWLLAAVGGALLFLPQFGMGVRVPWHRLGELLSAPGAQDALRISVTTCLTALAAIVVLGVPTALAISRMTGRAAGLARTLVAVPVVLPPVVAGLALTAAFGRRGILGPALHLAGIEIGFTWVAVVLAQVVVAAPFLILPLEAAIRSIDPEFHEDAVTAGAGAWARLRWVTLPLVGPALVMGVATAFARALGEFGATLTFAGSLQGRTRTMPMEIYLQRESDTATALALSVTLIALAAVVLAVASWLSHRWALARIN